MLYEAQMKVTGKLIIDLSDEIADEQINELIENKFNSADFGELSNAQYTDTVVDRDFGEIRLRINGDYCKKFEAASNGIAERIANDLFGAADFCDLRNVDAIITIEETYE